MLEPDCPREKGNCITSQLKDRNNGVKKLNSLDGNTYEAKQKCLALCKSVSGATGCEIIWGRDDRGCYAHTLEIAKGSGRDNYACWVFTKCIQGDLRK